MTDGEGRLRAAVRRRYPVWGWREAEEVVDEVMDRLVEQVGLAQTHVGTRADPPGCEPQRNALESRGVRFGRGMVRHVTRWLTQLRTRPARASI